MNEDYDIKRRLHLVSSHERGDEDRERLEREHVHPCTFVYNPLTIGVEEKIWRHIGIAAHL